MGGQALADAALALVGTRFRLQGREPATGIDCVGVLSAALTAIGREAPLPVAYSMRTLPPAGLDAILAGCGLWPGSAPYRAGDVVLARIGGCQTHVLIALGSERFVHAHAGLRRVVELQGQLSWPAIGPWRLAGEE